MVVKAAVYDGFYLPLLFAVDYDRWRRWCDLSWVGIVGGVFQE